MKLYILRHGETDWNLEKRLQGQLDVPLNEKGRCLAKVSGQSMKDIPFSAAFASDLSRAYETAGLILKYNPAYRDAADAFLRVLPEEKKSGLIRVFDCPVLRDRRLNEMKLGSWEGMLSADIPGRGLKDYWQDRTAKGFPEGMECADDLLVRARDFLEDIIARPELSDRHVLVVTHGGFLRSLLWILSGGPEFGSVLFRNCEAAIADIDPQGRVLSLERQIYYDPELANKGETY